MKLLPSRDPGTSSRRRNTQASHPHRGLKTGEGRAEGAAEGGNFIAMVEGRKERGSERIARRVWSPTSSRWLVSLCITRARPHSDSCAYYTEPYDRVSSRSDESHQHTRPTHFVVLRQWFDTPIVANARFDRYITLFPGVRATNLTRENSESIAPATFPARSVYRALRALSASPVSLDSRWPCRPALLTLIRPSASRGGDLASHSREREGGRSALAARERPLRILNFGFTCSWTFEPNGAFFRAGMRLEFKFRIFKNSNFSVTELLLIFYRVKIKHVLSGVITEILMAFCYFFNPHLSFFIWSTSPPARDCDQVVFPMRVISQRPEFFSSPFARLFPPRSESLCQPRCSVSPPVYNNYRTDPLLNSEKEMTILCL